MTAAIQLADHPALQPGGGLDDSVYVEFGRRVAAGDLALGPEAYFVSPLYAYFLGAVFALTGGSLFAARLVQAVLGAAGVALLMHCAGSWFGRRAGLIAGGLAALTGLFAFNEILLLQSSLDTFLTAVVLFAVTRAVRSGTNLWFAAAGVAFAALGANRPNALACLVVAAVTWAAVRRSSAALRNVAALLLGASLLLGPIALRNRVIAGEWVLVTSHGGLNFLVGNGEGAAGVWRKIAGVSNDIRGQQKDTVEVASAALGRRVSAGDASNYFYGRAWRWIRDHPGEWLRLLARKALLTLSAHDAALNFSYLYFSREQATIFSWLPIGPWLIVPLGVAGLVFGVSRAERGAYLTWASLPVAYALTLVAFFVASRYRLPLLAPLVAAGGFLADSLWQAARTRAVRRLAPQLAALVVLGVVVNWPIGLNDGRAFQREFHIVHLLTDGRVGEAERLIEQAEARGPLPGSLLCRVGLLLRGRGDTARAIVYMQRASVADPAHPWIRFHLGETLLSAGRPADAVPHLESARDAFAASPAPYDRADGISRLERGDGPQGRMQAIIAVDLAGAYTLLGQLDRARVEIRRLEPSAEVGSAGLLQLGEAAAQIDDAETAEKFLRAAVALNPSSAAAFQQLGFALGMQRRFDEAIQALEKAVALDSRNAVAYRHLGLAYAQARRVAEARAALEACLRLNPGDEEARLWWSRLPPRR